MYNYKLWFISTCNFITRMYVPNDVYYSESSDMYFVNNTSYILISLHTCYVRDITYVYLMGQ